MGMERTRSGMKDIPVSCERPLKVPKIELERAVCHQIFSNQTSKINVHVININLCSEIVLVNKSDSYFAVMCVGSHTDHSMFLGNPPPTLSLTQHFALSDSK